MLGIQTAATQGNDAVPADAADAPGVIGIDIHQTVDEYIAVVECLDPRKVDPENTGGIRGRAIRHPPHRTSDFHTMIPVVVIHNMDSRPVFLFICIEPAASRNPSGIVKVRPVGYIHETRILNGQCPFLHLRNTGGCNLRHPRHRHFDIQSQVITLEIDHMVTCIPGPYGVGISHILRYRRPLGAEIHIHLHLFREGIGTVIRRGDTIRLIVCIIFRECNRLGEGQDTRRILQFGTPRDSVEIKIGPGVKNGRRCKSSRDDRRCRDMFLPIHVSLVVKLFCQPPEHFLHHRFFSRFQTGTVGEYRDNGTGRRLIDNDRASQDAGRIGCIPFKRKACFPFQASDRQITAASVHMDIPIASRKNCQPYISGSSHMPDGIISQRQVCQG